MSINMPIFWVPTRKYYDKMITNRQRFKRFEVFPQLLVLPTKQTTTHAIELNWINDFCLHLKMTNNLPKCCTIDQPENLTKPLSKKIQIKVTYNSLFEKPDDLTSGPFWIKLTHQVTKTDPDPLDVVTINVNILNGNQEEPKSEALECKICLLEFSDTDVDLTPIILTGCGHTICQTCATTSQRRSRNGQIKCPFDRKETGGFVVSLPKNYVVLDLIREKNESNLVKKMMATEICENPDVPCYENPKHESSCYCTECKAEFCQNCFNKTHSSKIFANHVSIPLSEKPINLPNCPIHKCKKARFICKDQKCKMDSKICCKDCLRLEHKSHEHENFMETANKNQEKLEELIQKLKEVEDQTQKRVEYAGECVRSYEIDNVELQRKANAIMTHFENQKNEALQKLEAIVTSKKEQMQMGKEQIEYDLGSMAQLRKDIQRMLKMKTDLLDIKAIVDKVEIMSALDTGKDAKLVPFSPDSYSDDMGIGLKISTATPPTDVHNVEYQKSNRPIAIAKRRKQDSSNGPP